MAASSENTSKPGTFTPDKFIRSKARSLPLGKCYINESWYDMGKGSLIVTRRHSNGNVTCGFYLVDLFCEGVKDTFYLFNISEAEFENVLDEMSEKEELLEIEYTLAHNIIYGAMYFAFNYRLKPHKSFQLNKFILEGEGEEIEHINIPFGIDSKPAVVITPDDPKEKIIRHLNKLVGAENFIVMNESDFEDEDELDEESAELNGYDAGLEERDKSLLGNYQDYSEAELLREVEELGEESMEEAFGPIHELFLRFQDMDKFEALYEKHSRCFDQVTVVNDFHHPGLNYLPDDQLGAFYELGELAEKHPENAIIALRKKLIEFPHPVYEHLMVSAFGYLGMHQEATDLLKKAIEKYSNDFMLRVGYGFILLMNEQYSTLKMFMSGFDLKKINPDRDVFHILEIGRFLCLVCCYYALTNQLLMASVYQKILDDFVDIPESVYYQKVTTFKVLCPLQWDYIEGKLRKLK